MFSQKGHQLVAYLVRRLYPFSYRTRPIQSNCDVEAQIILSKTVMSMFPSLTTLGFVEAFELLSRINKKHFGAPSSKSTSLPTSENSPTNLFRSYKLSVTFSRSSANANKNGRGMVLPLRS